MNLDENALNFGTYSKEDLDQKLSTLIFDKTKNKYYNRSNKW